MTKVYVGRWDLLPAEWEGYNGLVEKNRLDILNEIYREQTFYDDSLMGSYRLKEFEEAFNYDSDGKFDSDVYWIRIFE